jgi:hypothetical protein
MSGLGGQGGFVDDGVGAGDGLRREKPAWAFILGSDNSDAEKHQDQDQDQAQKLTVHFFSLSQHSD